MNESKICPLLCACPADIPPECKGDRCAWFHCGQCAILELAMNTGDIQNVADGIYFRGSGCT